MGRTRKKEGEHGALYNSTYNALAWLFSIFFRVKTVGLENVPEKNGFMVCANHTSATDPIVLCIAMRRQKIHFMAKKELFKVPVLASFFRLLGAFPVDRGGSDVGALKKAISYISDGMNMGIFPQGHRFPKVDPRETTTKNGAALIATKANADILPCYILRKNNKYSFLCKTLVIIGEPIAFEDLGYDPEASGEYARITDIVFDKICTLGESYEAGKR